MCFVVTVAVDGTVGSRRVLPEPRTTARGPGLRNNGEHPYCEVCDVCWLLCARGLHALGPPRCSLFPEGAVRPSQSL